jgi:hypothetical protein
MKMASFTCSTRESRPLGNVKIQKRRVYTFAVGAVLCWRLNWMRSESIFVCINGSKLYSNGGRLDESQEATVSTTRT